MRLRRQRELICQQLVELVTDYLAGDLDPAKRDAVELHLAHCGDCRGYVEQVQAMLTLTAGLSCTDDVPEALVESLTARYRKRR